MAEQQQWYAGKPGGNRGLGLASDTEAYGGHLGKARELTKRAVEVELLDGSISASGRGPRQRLASEDFARCRCRPRPGARRLQRFPHAVERRRP